MLVACWLASDSSGDECNVKCRIVVTNGEFCILHSDHIDAKLLAQFAPYRIEVRLTRLALPTGELPKAAVPFVERSLAHEKVMPARHNGCNHSDN